MTTNKLKIRIQLLDESLRVISDRLVSQYEELLNGPSEAHKGPVRVEFTLVSNEDRERLRDYLEKLAGNLPLNIKSTVKKMTSNKGNNPYKEIYLGVKKKEYVETVIEELEALNFRWVTEQFLQELPADKKPSGLPGGYQWLCRMERQAKDPANDKFDFNLMFGIKFMGPKAEKIYVIYKGEKKAVLKKPWKKASNINLKKKKVALIFPTYMSIEDRKKWRYLRRKVELNKDLGPRDQKFYERYLPEIQNLDKKAEEEKSQKG